MKRINRAGKSPAVIFGLGALGGMLAAWIMISLFALLLTKIDVNIKYIPYFLLAAGFAGSWIAAVLSTRKTTMRGIVSGMLSAGVFSCLFLLLCFIICGFHFHLKMFTLLPVDLIGGMLGGILAKNMRK